MKCNLILNEEVYRWEATLFIPRVGEVINLGGVSKVIAKGIEYEFHPSTGELIKINIIAHHDYAGIS